jgi:hypothetical protein
LLADKEISLAGTRFQADSEEGKRSVGLGSQRMVRFGDTFSHEIVGRLEELAMPRFDVLYYFARWNDSNESL